MVRRWGFRDYQKPRPESESESASGLGRLVHGVKGVRIVGPEGRGDGV